LDHEYHEISENRETANADMQQAIPGLVGDSASGRAEEISLFTKIWLREPNFGEKIKQGTMLPQANRASILDKRPV
jgi:hypothetical protein